eukprot:gene5575-46757_t
MRKAGDGSEGTKDVEGSDSEKENVKAEIMSVLQSRVAQAECRDVPHVQKEGAGVPTGLIVTGAADRFRCGGRYRLHPVSANGHPVWHNPATDRSGNTLQGEAPSFEFALGHGWLVSAPHGTLPPSVPPYGGRQHEPHKGTDGERGGAPQHEGGGTGAGSATDGARRTAAFVHDWVHDAVAAALGGFDDGIGGPAAAAVAAAAAAGVTSAAVVAAAAAEDDALPSDAPPDALPVDPCDEPLPRSSISSSAEGCAASEGAFNVGQRVVTLQRIAFVSGHVLHPGDRGTVRADAVRGRDQGGSVGAAMCHLGQDEFVFGAQDGEIAAQGGPSIDDSPTEGYDVRDEDRMPGLAPGSWWGSGRGEWVPWWVVGPMEVADRPPRALPAAVPAELLHELLHHQQRQRPEEGEEGGCAAAVVAAAAGHDDLATWLEQERARRGQGGV